MDRRSRLFTFLSLITDGEFKDSVSGLLSHTHAIIDGSESAFGIKGDGNGGCHSSTLTLAVAGS